VNEPLVPEIIPWGLVKTANPQPSLRLKNDVIFPVIEIMY